MTLTLNKGLWTPAASGPPGFPTNPVLDDFNRANEGPPPSASWGGIIGSTGNGLKVVSNELAIDTGSDGTSYWNTSFNANQYVSLKVSGTGLSGASGLYLYGRLQDIGANVDGYVLVYGAGGPDLILRRMDDTTLTTIGGPWTVNLNSGSDHFGLSMDGTTIEAWYKQGAGSWTSAGSVTDATYNTTGYIAVGLSNANGDDFGGGNL